MPTRSIVLAFASVLLALTAGPTSAQDPKSEVEALKAQLEKAIRELEESKKQLAKAKAELEALKAEAFGPPLKVPPKDVQTELLKRWNAVADDKTFYTPDSRPINFTWAEYMNFPHPTFKGGSGEAYGALGQVLVAFLQKEGNFEYLVKNDLFTMDLVVGGGPRPGQKGIRTSFATWAKQLCDPKSIAKMDDESRKALAELSKKIEATVKKDEPKK
jgi:hypothetical protein